MNIVLLEPADWISEHAVRLTHHRHQHLSEVLRVTVGQTLRVGVIDGDRGKGTVTHIDSDSTTLHVELVAENSLCRHPLTVVLSLPRPKMLRRVLRTCAEFGVGDLHLIHSYRVEKSFWQSPLLARERVAEALRAGMERSGDPVMPKVTQHKRFRPFMEDVLPHIVGTHPLYCLHPGKHLPLGGDSPGTATVLIGPEGGFIPFEVQLAQTKGALLRSLGERILSVDTAVNTALARTS